MAETTTTPVVETSENVTSPGTGMETYRSFTIFGIIFVAVSVTFFVWVVILVVVQGTTGTWVSLNLFFGVMFGGSIFLWLIPIKHKPEDMDTKIPCKKSRKWWFEEMSLLILVMFCMFIDVSIYMVTIVGSSPTSDTVANTAFITATVVAVLCLVYQGLHTAGDIFTIVAFGLMLFLNVIPGSGNGNLLTTIFGSLSLFIILLVSFAFQKIISSLIGDLRMHTMISISAVFGGCFLFDSYATWIDMSLSSQWIEYMIILVLIAVRVPYVWFLLKGDKLKAIEDAVIYRYAERPIKSKKEEMNHQPLTLHTSTKEEMHTLINRRPPSPSAEYYEDFEPEGLREMPSAAVVHPASFPYSNY